MIQIFRAVVAISTALYAFGYWLPYFAVGSYPYEWQVLLAYDGDGSIIESAWWLELSIFVITLIISVMLFFLIPIARTAYLLLIIVMSLSTFLWGLRISTPLENFIWSLVAMSDGALLAMLYLTSVGGRFQTSAA
jgi:hypothetical protein